MQFRFFICDVFTTNRFGGNQLAVLPDAQRLSTERMQQIAREFNYSESTFVTPGEDSLSRNVRIFTPSIEVPFAGHPNVGTAFVLANDGAFGDIGDGITVTFEEAAGPVPVSVRRDDEGRIWCELVAPEPLSLGASVDAARIAKALSLSESDIQTSIHGPQVASVGLPFLIVELASTDALSRARADVASLESFREEGVVPDVHMYVRSDDDFDIRARMFAPLDGVPEDPATGSANCALVALLTKVDKEFPSGGSWRIAQGIEMGRPSLLEARTSCDNDTIKVWIGGYSVLIAEGSIEVE